MVETAKFETDSGLATAAEQQTDGSGFKLNAWTIATLAIVLCMLAPIIAVFAAASGDSGDLWGHLASSVLPRYITNTLTLMTGVAAISLLFGISAAWAVT